MTIPNNKPEGFRGGIRAALPLGLPALVLGASFAVLAAPAMGGLATIVMSVVVAGGAAQFAALSVLLAGGGVGAAVGAGLLMNARYVPMGVAIAPSLPGGPLVRGAQGQALVDASWAMANQGSGRFDRFVLIGATLPQIGGWIVGTILGVAGGSAIPDPNTLGLDAVFPAFYLALLAAELGSARARLAAGLAGVIVVGLTSFAPPGVPVIAASLAALIGLSGVGRRERAHPHATLATATEGRQS
jgi:predicted branched-subunit amino acid permease